MQCERRPIVRGARSLDNWKCVRPCGGKDAHHCRSSTLTLKPLWHVSQSCSRQHCTKTHGRANCSLSQPCLQLLQACTHAGARAHTRSVQCVYSLELRQHNLILNSSESKTLIQFPNFFDLFESRPCHFLEEVTRQSPLYPCIILIKRWAVISVSFHWLWWATAFGHILGRRTVIRSVSHWFHWESITCDWMRWILIAWGRLSWAMTKVLDIRDGGSFSSDHSLEFIGWPNFLHGKWSKTSSGSTLPFPNIRLSSQSRS